MENELLCGEIKEIRGMKTQIFVEEPYGPEAIMFYKIVFGAVELSRFTKTIDISDKIKGSGKFHSCELKFGPSTINVSERNPDSYFLCGVKKSSAGTRIRLVFEEIDSIVADAVELGAVVCQGGDRTSTGHWLLANIKDPYGIIWIIRSHAYMPLPAHHMEE